MEFEELNIIWNNYNAKLDKNIKLNEKLLRKINLNATKRELAKPVMSEKVSIILTFIFIFYLTTLSILFMNEPRFSIPGFLAAGSALTLIGFALNRIKAINQIDHVNDTVLDIQKKLFALQVKKFRWGWVELIFGISASIFMWPLVLLTGFDIDVYHEFSRWLLTLLVVAIFTIPVTIFYEKSYRKNLKIASYLLKEIQDFENEGNN